MNSALCDTPYWQNTKVWSRNGLHVGGSALVPCPAARRVQACLLGVAVPVIHSSNLPNRSVSGIASDRFLRSSGTGWPQSCFLVPLSCKSALFVLVARRCGITSLLNCAFCLGRFPTYSIVVLKLLFLTVLESDGPFSSSGLEEVL